MRRIVILMAALATTVAAANEADAQYRRPRQTVVVTMSVDSYGPQSGPVGTVVTLNGKGFTRKTTLLVGGRVVRPTSMGAKSISFRVPASYGDGTIVLRKPGQANDYVVGRFDVIADPVFSSFAPVSGAPGTRVELRGRNFRADDQVMYGNIPLAVESYSPTSVVVTIPAGAANDYFAIKSAQGYWAKGRRPFKVVAPAPYVDSFGPTHGEPGTVVRLKGGHYGNDIQVFYGRQSMPIQQTGNGWIEVAIPANANRDFPITIRSRRGGVTTAQPFHLELPPVLGSYSPAWGSVGSRVLINGRNFQANDAVYLNGQRLDIVQLQGGQITVQIPQGARSGAFEIRRGNRRVRAASNFDVLYAPVIRDLAPRGGAPGTLVNLTGQNLDGCRIFLGNQEIRPRSVSPNGIQFAIPKRGLRGKLRVLSRGGEAWSPWELDVWNFPKIQRISPLVAGPGSTLTVYGQNLDNATQYFAGNVELPIVSRRGGSQVVVKIPDGARSGAISWTAFGQNKPTRHNLTIPLPPSFQSFSPREGGPGTRVTISGTNFDARTQVLYGNQPLRVLSWSPTSLQVELPRNINKSDYFSVQGIGGGTSARQPFGIIVPPSLTRYLPARAKPGSQVTLYGNTLGMNTSVTFGTTPAQVIRVQRDGGLVVQVPELGTGAYEIWVQNKGLRATNRQRFAVDGWGQVTDIRPRQAYPGQTIQLSGAGLAACRIFWGNTELPVVKRDRRGRKLWVSIPDGISGSRALTVDDGGHRLDTSFPLSIQAPQAPKGPKVRDHRKGKGKGPYRGKGPRVRDHRRR